MSKFFEEEIEVAKYFLKMENYLDRKIESYTGDDIKLLAGLKYLISRLEERVDDL